MSDDQRGFGRRVGYLVKYHLHILLYAYFWLGLVVCGLFAPADRVAELDSALVTRGWHLSLLATVLMLPVPILYVWRMRRRKVCPNKSVRGLTRSP